MSEARVVDLLADGKVTLHCGDCLTLLATLEANSIDAIVTDPPYHLTGLSRPRADLDNYDSGKGNPFARRQAAMKGFMGKDWDGGDIAFRPELWREVLRVLKPGAHLLSFGGTRTYHRMACAIEDAGFEIRDSVQYLYGSGFPKSLNVGKSAGHAICSCEALPERDVRPLRDGDVPPSFDAGRERSEVLFAGLPQQGSHGAVSRAESPQGSSRGDECSMEGRRDIPPSQGELCPGEVRPLPAGTDFNGEGGRLRDGTSAGDGALDWPSSDQGGMRSPRGSSAVEQCADQSRTLAGQPQPQKRGAWDRCGRCGKPMVPEGLGTALKPACEPIVLARKPLSESTVAANVLKWGTGALNIDGCRVEGEFESGWSKSGSKASDNIAMSGANYEREPRPDSVSGRWPANVIHDGSDEVVGAFPASDGGGSISNRSSPKTTGIYGAMSGEGERWAGYADEGSAARFFYTAKADADDRLGSKHPTVKPLDLMQYLCRLVCPPRGIVLDPFAGTGTTGEAALREGMRAVLIEREAEYQDDIRRRMRLAMSGPNERAHEAIKAKTKGKPVDSGPLFGGTAEAVGGATSRQMGELDAREIRPQGRTIGPIGLKR